MRVAATGDLHFGPDLQGTLAPDLARLDQHADVLLIAGDLTLTGAVEEAKMLSEELRSVPVPACAVLGNHDYHQDNQEKIEDLMRDAGVEIVERRGVIVEVPGGRLGIAGTIGFGGGFAGASGTEFGEQEMKAFIRRTRELAEALRSALEALEADRLVALLHYSPIEGTLRGERPEIYPFLGSYLLAEAADAAGVDLIVHGHAHAGVERGVTPGGRLVRNVSRPVIGHAFSIYELE